MKLPWQQPIRPMEILISPIEDPNELWVSVLFIRPCVDRGWEVMTCSGAIWSSGRTNIREVTT